MLQTNINIKQPFVLHQDINLNIFVGGLYDLSIIIIIVRTSDRNCLVLKLLDKTLTLNFDYYDSVRVDDLKITNALKLFYTWRKIIAVLSNCYF